MKKILTLILVAASTLAVAQKKSHLSRSVDDDGKTLSIRVTGTINGKDVDYERSFDVGNMSKEERSALRDGVLESISAGNLNIPEPPRPPAPPKVSVRPETSPEPVIYSSGSRNPGHFYSDDYPAKAAIKSDEKGFSKQVRYNSESGEMFLRYTFIKSNEEFIYEKTVNALDKTESQRQQIIEKFENEIALPGKEIEM